MFTSTLVRLTIAKRIGFSCDRSLANGIDDIASNPTISANQTTYSLWLGYRSHSAIGTRKTEQSTININDVLAMLLRITE